ncbi:hypothetical protein ACROYT_G014657 [Oculina patagonica]
MAQESVPTSQAEMETAEPLQKLPDCLQDLLALTNVFDQNTQTELHGIQPHTYKLLHNAEIGCVKSNVSSFIVVVVVSPLEYICKQQVAVMEKLNCGISAAAIGESTEINNEIEEGWFNIVYGRAKQWFSALSTKQRWLGNKGKAAFKEAFGSVIELRPCLESGTPLLGLTATANKDMRDRLTKCLGLRSTEPIIVSPNKDNIRFTYLEADKDIVEGGETELSMSGTSLIKSSARTPAMLRFQKFTGSVKLSQKLNSHRRQENLRNMDYRKSIEDFLREVDEDLLVYAGELRSNGFTSTVSVRYLTENDLAAIPEGHKRLILNMVSRLRTPVQNRERPQAEFSLSSSLEKSPSKSPARKENSCDCRRD